MFCNKCGNQVPDGVKFCPKCGNRIPEKTTTKAEQTKDKVGLSQSNKDTSDIESSGISTNTQIQAEQNSLNKEIEPEKQQNDDEQNINQRVCNKCGNIIPEGVKFCPKCGTKCEQAGAVHIVPDTQKKQETTVITQEIENRREEQINNTQVKSTQKEVKKPRKILRGIIIALAVIVGLFIAMILWVFLDYDGAQKFLNGDNKATGVISEATTTESPDTTDTAATAVTTASEVAESEKTAEIGETAETTTETNTVPSDSDMKDLVGANADFEMDNAGYCLNLLTFSDGVLSFTSYGYNGQYNVDNYSSEDFVVSGNTISVADFGVFTVSNYTAEKGKKDIEFDVGFESYSNAVDDGYIANTGLDKVFCGHYSEVEDFKLPEDLDALYSKADVDYDYWVDSFTRTSGPYACMSIFSMDDDGMMFSYGIGGSGASAIVDMRDCEATWTNKSHDELEYSDGAYTLTIELIDDGEFNITESGESPYDVSLNGSYCLASDVDSSYSNEFVFPESNSENITEADCKGLTATECMIARNEIYAREGREFKDETLNNYFSSCDWYDGQILPDDFTDDYLNDYEKKNLQIIVGHEKKMGYSK